MAITYKLQAFEGPLDLLLHLIEVNKVNIYDIPIAEITDQYLAYISELETSDMELSSEFLVMAATLLRIKSQMLLPAEQEEMEDEGDPRLELVRRLLEHKMYQMAGDDLRDDLEEASRKIYKEKTIPGDLVYEDPPVDLDALLSGTCIEDLKSIFEDVIRKQAEKIDPIRSKYGNIEQEPVNVRDQIETIRRILKKKNTRINFREFLDAKPGREEIIVTFLAMLEMIKSGAVKVFQEDTYGEIEIIAGDQIDVEIEDVEVD